MKREQKSCETGIGTRVSSRLARAEAIGAWAQTCETGISWCQSACTDDYLYSNVSILPLSVLFFPPFCVLCRVLAHTAPFRHDGRHRCGVGRLRPKDTPVLNKTPKYWLRQ